MDLMQQVFIQLRQEYPLLIKTVPYITAALSSLVVLATCWQRFRNDGLDLPVMGHDKETDFRAALEEGAEKYPNTPFILATPMHPTVILPLSIMDEIKNLPEDILSLRQHHYTIFLGQYTGFGEPCDQLDVAIRSDLTRHLEQNLETFHEEVVYAFDKYVGECKEWTERPLYDTVLGIVCLLSSRAFVGLPLSRDEEWIHVSTRYALDGGHEAHSLSPYPRFIRPLLAPFMLRRLKRYRAIARRLLQPVLDKIVEDMKNGQTKNKKAGGDLMRYILNHYNDEPVMEHLARDQLNASFAAMHTTTICITQTMFDLAARPEYIAPLREELASIMETDGALDGRLHKQSMVKLAKMDSVVRESQRTNPPGLVSMLRRITARKGLTLSTGHHIPYGTVVGFSAHEVTRKYPNFEKYDGFRFANLRKEPGQATRHQLVATGPDQISFGHGTHGCPGRFFAASEIKVVMAHLLQHYDIKLLDGAKRPGNVHAGATVSPANDKILFRKRVD